ncbi:MAG: YdeI/OmpD-associated family protein [Sporichthyaceae bacterium]
MAPQPSGAVFFSGPAEFEAWLETHAGSATEIWIRMAKKHTKVASLDWAGAVEVALCFGWIDGIMRRIDEDYFVQRFTPRRPRGMWSKVNRTKVEALIAAGRMRPSGQAEIDAAIADGRWAAAYDGMSTATVPDDLAAALKKAKLTKLFASLSAQQRYSVLWRVQTATSPAARARRINAQVDKLAAGETPNLFAPRRGATE